MRKKEDSKFRRTESPHYSKLCAVYAGQNINGLSPFPQAATRTVAQRIRCTSQLSLLSIAPRSRTPQELEDEKLLLYGQKIINCLTCKAITEIARDTLTTTLSE